jgi:hypothetical protein
MSRMPDDERPRRSFAGWIVLLVLLAVGAYFYLRQTQQEPAATPPAVSVPEETGREPLVRHPLPEPGPAEETAGGETPVSGLSAHLPVSLPALDDSDPALLTLIGYLVENPRLGELLVPRSLIRRIVVTVDSLPGPAVPLNHLPATFPPERFLVVRSGDGIALDERNHARYGRHVALLDGLDSAQLARAYAHFYPLFQEAYRELGYPQGFFNDRLIAVIDHLLDAPQAEGRIALEQPAVFYTYANPDYEALSAGQKLLLRMGPENAAAVKRKLREIRAELVR